LEEKDGVESASKACHNLFLKASFIAGVAVLSGCQSKKHIILDNRPSWVVQAERQLQNEARWNVSGKGVADGGSGGSSFFGASRPNASSADSSQDQSRARAAATDSARSDSSTAGNPAPPGVQWSETKITVSVED